MGNQSLEHFLPLQSAEEGWAGLEKSITLEL